MRFITGGQDTMLRSDVEPTLCAQNHTFPILLHLQYGGSLKDPHTTFTTISM